MQVLVEAVQSRDRIYGYSSYNSTGQIFHAVFCACYTYKLILMCLPFFPMCLSGIQYVSNSLTLSLVQIFFCNEKHLEGKV